MTQQTSGLNSSRETLALHTAAAPARVDGMLSVSVTRGTTSYKRRRKKLPEQQSIYQALTPLPHPEGTYTHLYLTDLLLAALFQLARPFCNCTTSEELSLIVAAMGKVYSSSRHGGSNVWASFVLAGVLILTPWMCLWCQAAPTEDYCTSKYIFVATDDSGQEANGNITSGVRVTMKDTSSPSDSEQTIFIPGEHLPSTCGDHFARCNVTLLTESTGSLTTPTSVLLVPLRLGVAQIVYERVNGTLRFVTRNVLRLPPQVDNCQITSLLDLREIPGRTLEEFDITIAVVGLCLNETSSINVKVVNMSIDFANPSKSSIRPLVQDAFHQITSQGVLSNFVLWLDLPRCLSSSFLLSPTYYFRQSRVGVFDATSSSGTQEFFVYYGQTRDEFICPSPIQLVRISDILIIYCENRSAEINICELGGDGVSTREERDSVRYFCSANMDTFISVSNKVATLNTSTSATVNFSLPLASDEDIFIANCLMNSESETDSASVLFAFTSTLGNTFLINFTAGLQDPQGTIVIQEQEMNNSSFVHHQVYDKLLLYNNGSNAVLLNTTSCMNRVELSHQFSLSLVVPGEGTHRCECASRSDVVTSAPDHTPVTEPDHTSSDVTQTDHTPSEATSEPDHTMPVANNIAGIISGVVLLVVVFIAIIAVAIGFKCKRKRSETVPDLPPPFAINPQFDQPMNELKLDLGQSSSGSSADGREAGTGHGGAPAGEGGAIGEGGVIGKTHAGDSANAQAGDDANTRTGDSADTRAGDTEDSLTGGSANACAGGFGNAHTGGSEDSRTLDSADTRAGGTEDSLTGGSANAKAGSTEDSHTLDSADTRTGDSANVRTGDAEDSHTGDGDTGGVGGTGGDNASGVTSGSSNGSRESSSSGDGRGYVTCDSGEGVGSRRESSGRSASINEQNGKNSESRVHVPNQRGTLTSYVEKGIHPTDDASTAEERGRGGSPNNDIATEAASSQQSGQDFVTTTVAVEEQRDSHNRTQ